MIGAAIAGGSALIQTGIGIAQGIKANRMMKRLKRPTQHVQKEFTQNAAISENMARTGLQSQQYNNSLQNINRNATAGIRALGRSTNAASGLASMMRAQNDATLNLDMQDANARQANQRMAMQQRGILGAQKHNAWQWNEQSKYGEKLAEIQALKGAGMQNVAGGLNTAAQLGIAMESAENGGGSTRTQSTPAFDYQRASMPTSSGLGWNNMSSYGKFGGLKTMSTRRG